MSVLVSIKDWLKSSDNPLANKLFRIAKAVRYYNGPSLPWFYKLLWLIHHNLYTLIAELIRMFYFTPMFKTRLKNPPKSLLIYGGMPLVMGNLTIEVDEESRISAATTFAGRTAATETPLLRIGKNCDIGWQTGISVGSKVIIGDNVRIAGRSTISGYAGHPLNAKRRAAGEPEDDHQVGDIIIEDDVWLATGVNVMAGVTIGKGTVVASGSIVTKDLPPNVLAGGMPAKVIRTLTENDDAKQG